MCLLRSCCCNRPGKAHTKFTFRIVLRTATYVNRTKAEINMAKQVKKTVIPDKLLNHLLNFEPIPAPVISLYLDARADQHGQQNFLPFVRKQMAERSKSYENQSDERKSFEEDFVRIVRYLEG